MSINLDAKLTESATKVAVTRNEYGDITYGATTTSLCLYRDITTLTDQSNKEGVTVDGFLWFAAAETVARGDIYNHADEGYLRIIKVTNAKTLLTDNVVKFIKCQVAKQRQLS